MTFRNDVTDDDDNDDDVDDDDDDSDDVAFRRCFVDDMFIGVMETKTRCVHGVGTLLLAQRRRHLLRVNVQLQWRVLQQRFLTLLCLATAGG
jgi:hypothetical protein